VKQATLAAIAPLLEVLRAHPALSEVRPAEFELDGRGFLHFHEERGGVVADVLLAEGRVTLPVSSRAEQAELLERIEHSLASLEARKRDRQRRGRVRKDTTKRADL
jgi:hypothetical protein